MTVYTKNNIYMVKNSFMNNSTIEDIDCCENPFASNDASYTFCNCTNLKRVSGLNDNITNMCHTFQFCYNLTSVPSVPNSVVDMGFAFDNCTNLVEAPSIPNNVVSMCQTFYNCYKLSNVPEIKSTNVVNLFRSFQNCFNIKDISNINTTNAGLLYYTFYNCRSLEYVNAYTIPDSIQYLSFSFTNCVSLKEIDLTGCNHLSFIASGFTYCNSLYNMTIPSKEIRTLMTPFTGTSLQKNVYIPFTYQDGDTKTLYRYINTPNNLDFYLDYDIEKSGGLTITNGYLYSNGSNDTRYARGRYQVTEGAGTFTVNSTNGSSYIFVNDYSNNIELPMTSGSYTQTYNTFISAGYDTSGTLYGVYLKDLNQL